MSLLFPITSHWSWFSFFLYVSISYVVVFLCKCGACGNRNSMITVRGRYVCFNFNLYYLSAVFILVVFATIRTHEVGVDTFRYVEEFEMFQNLNIDWKRVLTFHQEEPGYQLFLNLVKKISDNYHILFFAIYTPLAFAYINFIRYFYDSFDSYIFLPLFIFYYFSNMSGMRSALGTIFLLYSFVQVEKRKYFNAIILTFVACLFHYTMMYNFYIIFIIWFFTKPQVKEKKSLWIVGICLGVVASNLGLTMILSLFADTKYSYYTSAGGNESFLGSIVFVIFGILAICKYRDIVNTQRKSTLLLIDLAFLVTYPMIYLVGAYRIPNYYILPRLVIWDYALDAYGKELDRKSRRILKIAVKILVLVYLLFRFTRASTDGGFVYHI